MPRQLLLLPRFIDRRHHPLRVYAFLELGIGAFGLLVLFGMPLMNSVYVRCRADPASSGILLRGVVAAICLLPPTLLMGATLPAISRWVESTPEGVSWLGFFYGGNIAGGVLGSLLAGFYLLRVYDIGVATYVAVALNVDGRAAGDRRSPRRHRCPSGSNRTATSTRPRRRLARGRSTSRSRCRARRRCRPR